MICCGHLSEGFLIFHMGPIHFILRELSKVNPQTSKRDQTGSEQSLKEQVAKKKIQGAEKLRMKEFTGEYGSVRRENFH